MHFEDLLFRAGDSDRYQRVLMLYVIIVKIFPACMTFLPVYINGSSQSYVCADAGWDRNSTDHCISINETTGKSVFCTSWNHSTVPMTSTLRSQFNLVCDQSYKMQLATTFFFMGFFIGSYGYGWLADRIGRRLGLLLSICHLSAAGISAAFAPEFWSFAFFRLLVGIGDAGIVCISITYFVEYLGKAKRFLWIMPNFLGWPIGIILQAIVAYFVHSHFWLQIICSLTPLLFLPAVLFSSESARWLYATNRREQAMKILSKVARFNGKKLFDEECHNESIELHSENKIIHNNENVTHTKTKVNILKLLETKHLRRVTVIMWFNWFVVCITYYFVSLGVGDLAGSVYLNQIISSVTDIIAYPIIIYLAMNFVGRPALLAIGFAGGGVSLLIYSIMMAVGSSFTKVMTGFALLGRFFFNSSFELVFIYTGEVMPTVMRTLGLGSCSASARIGGMLAPQVNLLNMFWEPLPFLLMGILPLISAVSCVLLPETRGRRLPESLFEGEMFSSGKDLDEPPTGLSESS